MRHLFFLFLIFILLSSCVNQNQIKQEQVFYNHTRNQLDILLNQNIAVESTLKAALNSSKRKVKYLQLFNSANKNFTNTLYILKKINQLIKLQTNCKNDLNEAIELTSLKPDLLNKLEAKSNIIQIRNIILSHRKETIQNVVGRINGFFTNDKSYYFIDPNFNEKLDRKNFEQILEHKINWKTFNFMENKGIVIELYYKFNMIVWQLNEVILDIDELSTYEFLNELVIIQKQLLNINRIANQHIKASFNYCPIVLNFPKVFVECPNSVKEKEKYEVKLKYGFVEKENQDLVKLKSNLQLKKTDDGFEINGIATNSENIIEGEYIVKKKSGEIRIDTIFQKIKIQN
jgi:hypothetical protein